MQSVASVVDEMLQDGMKVIAVARKKIEKQDQIIPTDENNMILMGYLAFFDAPKKTAKLYEAGYTPICPLLSLPEIINVSNADEFKDYVDMSEDMLRRSRILVVCGTAVDETVLTDIAIANRFHVASSTMRGVLTVDKSKKFE